MESGAKQQPWKTTIWNYKTMKPSTLSLLRTICLTDSAVFLQPGLEALISFMIAWTNLLFARAIARSTTGSRMGLVFHLQVSDFQST
jgi:hypothetical protein